MVEQLLRKQSVRGSSPRPRAISRVAFYSQVLVWWHDAAMTPGWHNPEAARVTATLGLALSSGFLVERTRKLIILSMGISAHGDVSHCFAIPRSQIVKVEVTREPGII